MIRHVKISRFWGEYEVDWQPHPDVNILVGVNGSGKSTLLRVISAALSRNDDALSCLERCLTSSYTVRIEGDGVNVNIESITFDTGVELNNSKVECGHSLVSTFDDIANEKKALEQQLSPLAAQLDAVIFDTQRQSLNSYRLKATENPDTGIRISQQLKQWIEVVNTFFATAGKTFEIQGSNVFFRQANGETLALSQLSSGEKQLLIILTNALVQDGKPFILLMDEPEISLDIDWQYKLVKTIRTLNPSCQLIIATHSPAVFGDGWNDKLFFMENLLKK
jgi:ABC-type cobalamin/Fe3+-siderophores transport system ATPase subunit